jgi:hypothetical protein
VSADDLRPPIPASLAHRPVRGGLASAWVNAELRDGGTDFRSPHTARYEQAWRHCWCQSCGNPTGPRAVLVCGPRQVLTLRFDEPPACPPCVPYISKACPFVSGRSVTYPSRRRLTEGHRGEKCFDPSCECGGWQETDPEHSADMGGQPNLPWYAVWIGRHDYELTGYVTRARCSDLGCEHDRTLINGALLRVLPLKVQLLSEPGRQVERQALTPDQVLIHAADAIESSGVKPAERSPLWDGKPLALSPPPERAAKPLKASRKGKPQDEQAMSLSGLKQAQADIGARRRHLKSEAARLKDELDRLEDGGQS